jgi:hypothetical protein
MALVESKSKTRRVARTAAPAKPRHWLDEIAPFSYHPKSPGEFVVVSPDGKWRKGE